LNAFTQADADPVASKVVKQAAQGQALDGGVGFVGWRARAAS